MTISREPTITRTAQTSRKEGSVKISLTIPQQLLKRVDSTAQLDYTTRSDVIRQALVDYLRAYEQACDGMEPERALQVLRRHLGMAYFNKTLKETKLNED